MDYIVGGALRWQTPLDGLRFSGTYMKSESTFSARTLYSGLMEQGPATVPVTFGITTTTDHTQDHSYVLSEEYRRNALTVSAEYWSSRVCVSNALSGVPFPMPPGVPTAEDSVGYYGQVAYRFAKWVEVSGYYSVFYPDTDDKSGVRYVALGQPASQAWSKDLTLSARFDITRNMLFKIEGHFIDGTSNLELNNNPQGLEDKWTMLLGRFTFYS